MKEKLIVSKEFSLRLGNAINAATSQRHDATHVVACALWVMELKRRRGLASAYQLEKLFEPEAFGRSANRDPYHRNKWAKYEVGVHLPATGLIQRVEALEPGTARLIEHPLWALLRSRSWEAHAGDRWLHKLSFEVQAVLFDNAHGPLGGGGTRQKFGLRLSHRLERCANLDAVAALTILLLDALVLERHEEAFEAAKALFRTLQVVCSFFPFSQLASEIFWLFQSRIYPLVEYDHMRFDFTDYDFGEAVMLLNRLLLGLEDAGRVKGWLWRHNVRGKLKLIHGGFGFDAQFGLMPPIVTSGSDQETAERVQRICAVWERARRWGLQVLREGRYERFVPVEVFLTPSDSAKTSDGGQP